MPHRIDLASDQLMGQSVAAISRRMGCRVFLLGSHDVWINHQLPSMVPDRAVEGQLVLVFVQPQEQGGALHRQYQRSFKIVTSMPEFGGLPGLASMRRSRSLVPAAKQGGVNQDAHLIIGWGAFRPSHEPFILMKPVALPRPNS